MENLRFSYGGIGYKDVKTCGVSFRFFFVKRYHRSWVTRVRKPLTR
jgi:hypothetical protein